MKKGTINTYITDRERHTQIHAEYIHIDSYIHIYLLSYTQIKMVKILI